MRIKRHRIFAVAMTLAAMVIVATRVPEARSPAPQAKAVRDAAKQSEKAARAFEAIMQVPETSIPRDLLARAKAIAVFPGVIKVAFTVGGEGGRGVVSQRVGAEWSDPVFFRAGGPSVGAQIGASSTDLFLLLMNDESVEGLMKDRFAVGGDVGVAAGPVGRNAGAGTDALMHAAIVSYSRSRGLFAGVNVKGIVIKPEDNLNRAVYNRTARELLTNQVSGTSGRAAGLHAFPQALSRHTDNPRDDR
jgi:lipid-binding SYLF domain-containing protein